MIQIQELINHSENGIVKGTNMTNDKITQSVAEAYKKMKQEELKGDQHKIDANKNNKIDAHDFHLLRKQKNEETEPKSEKEKNLAALGHPKDKVTHKDVLIGRGVLKKEGWDSKKPAVSEQEKPIDELSTSTLGKYATKRSAQNNTNFPKAQAGVELAVKKITGQKGVVAAKESFDSISEGKMGQLHADIGDHLDKHIKDYNAGNLGHDSFGEKVVSVHKKIADLHGISQDAAKKHVFKKHFGGDGTRGLNELAKDF
jgi:predicted transcriptional regulator